MKWGDLCANNRLYMEETEVQIVRPPLDLDLDVDLDARAWVVG